MADKSIVMVFTPVLVTIRNSVWQPGWVICGSSSLCNKASLIPGSATNMAYIGIYAPNYANVNISVRALSPFRASAGICLPGRPAHLRPELDLGTAELLVRVETETARLIICSLFRRAATKAVLPDNRNCKPYAGKVTV